MKYKNQILTVLLSMLLAFTSCSTIDPETGRESLGYFPARGYDFMDIFELSFGLTSTPSLYVAVAAEPLMVLGGIYEAEKFGIDGRLYGQWTEKRCELSLGLDLFMRYSKKPHWGNRYLFNSDYNPHYNNTDYDLFKPGDELIKPGEIFKGYTSRWVDHERRWGDVSVEVFVRPFGFDIGFSNYEFVDFVFGLFGFDVLCDDDWVDPCHEYRWHIAKESAVRAESSEESEKSEDI